MPDARILREITDALRVLHDRADAAGSPTARAVLTMAATAIHDMAVKAERDERGPARRPTEGMKRLGEG